MGHANLLRTTDARPLVAHFSMHFRMFLLFSQEMLEENSSLSRHMGTRKTSSGGQSHGNLETQPVPGQSPYLQQQLHSFNRSYGSLGNSSSDPTGQKVLQETECLVTHGAAQSSQQHRPKFSQLEICSQAPPHPAAAATPHYQITPWAKWKDP